MSTATETPGVTDPVWTELTRGRCGRKALPNPADVQRLAPNRDERLFLVLSIFIGVISGLLVVCFRVAINWIQVLTLGSSPHPGQLRLLFVPMGIGLLVAVAGAACLSRGAGQRHQPDQGSALHLQRLYLLQNGHREVHHLGSGHRWRILPRARRPLAANRGRRGLHGQPPAQSLARTAAHVCAHWRRRRPGGGFQRSYLGHSFRRRRGDRTVERGRSRLHCAVCHFERRGRALVLGRGADVSHPGGHAEGPAGTSCLRRSWHRGRCRRRSSFPRRLATPGRTFAGFPAGPSISSHRSPGSSSAPSLFSALPR